MGKNDKLNGVLYIILSAVSFGIMPILAKLAYNGGANTITTLFLRFLFASLMIFYYLKTNKISMKLNKSQVKIVIILGIAGYSLTSATLFMAYNYISVGMATMLLYTYPAIVTLFSTIIFKEKVQLKKIVCLLLSIGGIFTMIEVGGTTYNPMGILLGLLSSLCYSLYVLGASHKEIKAINSYVMTFYVSLLAAGSELIFGVATNTLNFNIEFYSFIAILLLAFISTVVALMAFLQGVKIIGSSNAAIFSTLEPIVSLILGVLILKEALTLRVVFGSILIIVSMIILAKE
ncbi:DMT family transporter [Clostridium tunisiense]|uniref:DMT family transporter n=1 Tax=Clostridium tunisiense TaxID=219748 RepID=UPI000307170D|nr:DMT family transporter [Clostridium tunisiense]